VNDFPARMRTLPRRGFRRRPPDAPGTGENGDDSSSNAAAFLGRELSLSMKDYPVIWSAKTVLPPGPSVMFGATTDEPWLLTPPRIFFRGVLPLPRADRCPSAIGPGPVRSGPIPIRYPGGDRSFIQTFRPPAITGRQVAPYRCRRRYANRPRCPSDQAGTAYTLHGIPYNGTFHLVVQAFSFGFIGSTK